MVVLNEEEVMSLNRILSGFVTSNKYIGSAISYYDRLIVFTDSNKLVFHLDEFTASYQKKFILNNIELYCTSLFLALKPGLITFLKNEGRIGYSFNCVFLLGGKRIDKIETIKVYK